MESWFEDKETGGAEGLLVLYDPQRDAVGLTWASTTEVDVPASGYLDLAPFFMKRLGGSNSWRNRSVHTVVRR
jgi:hypothetical protein